MKKLFIAAFLLTASIASAQLPNTLDPGTLLPPPQGSTVSVMTTQGTIKVGIHCSGVSGNGLETSLYGTGSDGKNYQIKTVYHYNTETKKNEGFTTVKQIPTLPCP